ncbi:MAG: hypothetical protein ACP5O7_12715 [Phycisphaerae bacterium]
MHAEIAATLKIIEAREYILRIERLIGAGKPLDESFFFTIGMREKYFLVYENNADKIGYLKPELAHDIATFYALIFSVIEDVKEPPPGQSHRVRSISEWEATLLLAKEAIAVGKIILGARVSSPANK